MLIRALTLITLCWLPLAAVALGLSEPRFASVLGEPLQASLVVRGVEQWSERQVSVAAVAELPGQGEQHLQATLVQSMAGATLLLSSRARIDAPLFQLQLTVHTPTGQLQRRYSVSLPVLRNAQRTADPVWSQTPNARAIPPSLESSLMAAAAPVSAAPAVQDSSQSTAAVDSVAESSRDNGTDSVPDKGAETHSDPQPPAPLASPVQLGPPLLAAVGLLLGGLLAAGLWRRRQRVADRVALRRQHLSPATAAPAGPAVRRAHQPIEFVPGLTDQSSPSRDDDWPQPTVPGEPSQSRRSVEFSWPCEQSAAKQRVSESTAAESSTVVESLPTANPAAAESLAEQLASCYRQLGAPALAQRVLAASGEQQ